MLIIMKMLKVVKNGPLIIRKNVKAMTTISSLSTTIIIIEIIMVQIAAVVITMVLAYINSHPTDVVSDSI